MRTARERQERALEEARERLDEALGTGDPEEAFAPLGEVLAWLYALAGDAPQGALLSGIKYARNSVLHGEGVLVATYDYEHGAELPMTLGKSRLGTTSGWRWRFASLPMPTDPRWRAMHRRYQENCAMGEVQVVLAAATVLVQPPP